MTTKQPAALKKRTTGHHIDISIRLKDDGGPLFAHICSITDPYARTERMRQLSYGGLMAERRSANGEGAAASPVSSSIENGQATGPQVVQVARECVVAPADSIRYDLCELDNLFELPSSEMAG